MDVTRAAGIDFHLNCGSKEKLYIVETQCGGAAAFDYDNDGWMDILLVDGSSIEDYRAGKCHPPRLYHNNHDGTFTDVSAKSGLNFCGWGYGVAIGDYDNDGWEDVYITGFHGSALFHNNHDGTFTDVTAKAGVANADRWGTSAAFGDYDNDGNLDLYVANYVDVDMNNLPKFGEGPFCQYRGIPVNCGPRGLKGARDRLYHNNGDGTFTDVTEKLGIDTGQLLRARRAVARLRQRRLPRPLCGRRFLSQLALSQQLQGRIYRSRRRSGSGLQFRRAGAGGHGRLMPPTTMATAGLTS